MYSECAGVPAVRIRAAHCGDARVAALPELSAGPRRVPPRESAPTECALAGDARRGERRDPRHLLHCPVCTRTRLLVQLYLSHRFRKLNELIEEISMDHLPQG